MGARHLKGTQMNGISNTSAALPAATTPAVGTAPAATDPNAVDPSVATSTAPTSAEQAAAMLDQPDPTYPALTQGHVIMLQAIGTPDATIAAIAAEQPTADGLDAYLRDQVMANPEGWDSFVGNPAGTARAGLQQLMPGVQLPAPVAGGAPGSTGVVPGATTEAPGAAGGGGGLVKGVLAAGAVVGLGIIGLKVHKARTAAAEAAQEGVRNIVGASSGAAAAGEEAAQTTFRSMGRSLIDAGATNGDMELMRRGMVLDAIGEGATRTTVETGAVADVVLRGGPTPNGFLQATGNAAMHFDMPMNQAIEAALEAERLTLVRRAIDTGQLKDFAHAQPALKRVVSKPTPPAPRAEAPASDEELATLVADVVRKLRA